MQRGSATLFLGLWLTSSTLLPANPLATVKPAYDQEAGKIRTEANAKYAALNQQYLRSLETLDAQFKQAGELESLLVVRKELERFKKSEALPDTALVSAPAHLATAQRAYVDAKNTLRRDRDIRLAKLTRAYLDQLAQLKKHLTQQDRIADALTVQREEDSVRTAVDLNPDEAPPPAPTGSRAGATAVAGTPPGQTATPYAMKPPKGYIWLYVTERGLPVKNQSFYFRVEPDGKTTEHTSDSFGKVSFLTEPGATYRVLGLSEKFAKVELTGVKEGEVYSVKIQPHPADAGLVEFRNKIAPLPELGRINLQNLYTSGTLRYGFLSPENSKIKVYGGDSTYSDRTYYVTDGAVATLQLGDLRYEVTCLVINDRWFLEYKKLPPPRR